MKGSEKQRPRGDVEFVAGAASVDRIPPAVGPEIAVAGRSNVGKSSLLNRLTGRRALARVGNTPGRTQQINFFAVGNRFTLVDLPGYGFARVPLPVKAKWRSLVEHYLTTRERLRGVVVLVDVRRGLVGDDADLLGFLAAHTIPAQLVATKIDRIKRSERSSLLRAIGGGEAIPFSSTTGEGTADLWAAIDAMLVAGED
jgi:GTP-binding protein